MRAKTITLKYYYRNPYLAAALVLLSAVMTWNICVVRAFVVQEDGRIYIVDQTGERWDVTQAQKLGFDPTAFQYGIGKHAFEPLNDQALSDATRDVRDDLRIIGVTSAAAAQAYSVPKLRQHEIANTHIDARAIAVGY